jgi:hypothetical protein
MDRLSLAALACLPEISPRQLGSLTWGLGKLGGKLGVHRLQTPVRIRVNCWCCCPPALLMPLFDLFSFS